MTLGKLTWERRAQEAERVLRAWLKADEAMTLASLRQFGGKAGEKKALEAATDKAYDDLHAARVEAYRLVARVRAIARRS